MSEALEERCARLEKRLKIAFAVAAVGVIVGGVATFLAVRAGRTPEKITLENDEGKLVLTGHGFVLQSKADPDQSASLLTAELLRGVRFELSSGAMMAAMSASSNGSGERKRSSVSLHLGALGGGGEVSVATHETVGENAGFATLELASDRMFEPEGGGAKAEVGHIQLSTYGGKDAAASIYIDGKGEGVILPSTAAPPAAPPAAPEPSPAPASTPAPSPTP